VVLDAPAIGDHTRRSISVRLRVWYSVTSRREAGKLGAVVACFPGLIDRRVVAVSRRGWLSWDAMVGKSYKET